MLEVSCVGNLGSSWRTMSIWACCHAGVCSTTGHKGFRFHFFWSANEKQCHSMWVAIGTTHTAVSSPSIQFRLCKLFTCRCSWIDCILWVPLTKDKADMHACKKRWRKENVHVYKRTITLVCVAILVMGTHWQNEFPSSPRNAFISLKGFIPFIQRHIHSASKN